MKARIPNQGPKGNPMKMIQDMQEKMEQKQAEIEATEFTACSGGGAVEVTVNGKNEVLSIKIQPDVVDPEEVDMLEDLLMASINEALRKSAETMDREMGSITGGLNIPGMPGLF